jgi:hypothetical protein
MPRTREPLVVSACILALAILAACPRTPETSPRLKGAVIESRVLDLPDGERLVGLRVRLVNTGRSEERIRRYFLRTSSGDRSEALADSSFRERFRDRVRSWGRSGLPTVVEPGSTLDGWVFFRNPVPPETLVFRLKNTYGSAERLVLTVPEPKS